MPSEDYLPLPPQHLEAEESVLGSMLTSKQAMAAAAAILAPEDFYRAEHGRIFASILVVAGRGEPVDQLTVASELRYPAFGEAFRLLGQMVDHVPSADHCDFYAYLVLDCARRRRLIETVARAQEAAYAGETDAGELIARLAAETARQNSEREPRGWIDIKASMQSAVDAAEQAMNRDEAETLGVPSGLTKLDEITGGFKPANLIVVAARPGVGKTSLAMCCAERTVAFGQGTVLFFSLEMSEKQIGERMVSIVSRVDSRRLETGNMHPFGHNGRSDFANVTLAAAEFPANRLLVNYQQASTPSAMLAAARDRAAVDQISLVVIDYVQLMKLDGRSRENRNEELSEISRALKSLAMELDAPVMAISQLNRNVEHRADRRPQLSDLRDTGALEQDADVVIMLSREDNRDSHATGPGGEPVMEPVELFVRKNRSGPVGGIRVGWTPAFTRFDDWPGGVGGSNGFS